MTEWEEFYDGHGCGDVGRTTKSVVIDDPESNDDTYRHCNDGETYHEGYLGPRSLFEDEDEEGDYDYYWDEENQHAQDGYHTTRNWVQVKEITEGEFNHYKLFIDGYNLIP